MTFNTKWLGRLLTDHVVMLGLWASALALPLLITAIFGGALNLDNTAPIMVSACFGLLVQIFWAVGSYLLISKEWSASVIAFAAATIGANTALAILSSMLVFRVVPGIAFDILVPMILASCSL